MSTDFAASPLLPTEKETLRNRAWRAYCALPLDREYRQLSFALPHRVDVLSWLRQQVGVPKAYWHARGDDQTWACAGAVTEWKSMVGTEALERVRRTVRGLDEGIRVVGGMAFSAHEFAPEWKSFGAVFFFIPRWTLVEDGAHTTLMLNLRGGENWEDVERYLEQLVQSTDDVATDPGTLPTARIDLPDFPGWQQAVESVLSAIEGRLLEKVVLARRVTFAFDQAVDAFQLMRRLQRGTPSAYHFLFDPGEGATFLGASPERLAWVAGRTLASEAVAGTRPRAHEEAEDDRLGEELLVSEKDLREHQFVRAHIEATLTPFTDQLSVDSTASEMKLARGRHLVSKMTGQLKADTHILDLLAALHPTPAVGGTPSETARDWLRRHEPFARGWYAGPIGWCDADGGEFAVGIRSGLVTDDALHLYSGAGIVTGSQPDAEWSEIGQKISDFEQALGLEPRN